MIKTFTANIYISLKNSPHTSPIEDVRKWLYVYCSSEKIQLTCTHTDLIFSDGIEPGMIIGLNQNPMSPKPTKVLKEKAIYIATVLMKKCCQTAVPIVFSNETIMLEKSGD